MPNDVSAAVNQPYIPSDDSKAILNGIADEFRDDQSCKAVMPLSSASTGMGFI
ncbi:MAG: hypothetical protein ABIB71_02675 [Candidatus Woesearchaeota archaeon]